MLSLPPCEAVSAARKRVIASSKMKNAVESASECAASYGYQAASGRLDTVGRSGYASVAYGYLGGSDHVASVTSGSWVRSLAWEAGREAISTVTQQ